MLDWRSQYIVHRFSFKIRMRKTARTTTETTVKGGDNGEQEQQGKKRRHLAKD
jgi:hypothetical protein